jgi:predicted DNA-binding transcriptional regulator AlpA
MTELETVIRTIVREEIHTALSEHAPTSAARGEATYLNGMDAGTRLGLSPETLYAWRREGKGPPYIRLGRRIMYKVADLDAWMAANRSGA